MNLALILLAGVVVVTALVVVGRRLRDRHGASSVRSEGERAGASPIPTAVGRAAAAGDFYAPSFIVDPGHCFRLCRDPVTGTASPCDRRVEGRGVFADHRGNLVDVAACGLHMVDLDDWRFDAVEG